MDGKLDGRADLGVVDDLLEAVQLEDSASERAEDAAHEDDGGGEEEASEAVDETFDDALEDASAPLRDGFDSPAFPPPAPTGLAVVVGSMIPIDADEDDEDSDSQDEDDGEQPELTPPLNLVGDDDDDDDELEVNLAVVDTIATKQASAVPATSSAVDTAKAAHTQESTLLAALPPPKPPSPTDEVKFSFADEVRAAHVVVPPSAFVDDPTTRATSFERGHDDSVESAFGISYASLRKKRRDRADASDRDGYSLPTAAAFPDEHEFESELALSSGVSLSVKTIAHEPSLLRAVDEDDNNDDEFGSVLASPAGGGEVSPRTIETRRASLLARTAQEEDRIIAELKRATDEEKARNDAGRRQSSGGVVADTAPPIAQSSESGSALTLRELHGIYKRGLGDQGVLLDESEGDGTKVLQTTASSSTASHLVPLSVMGRILSKPAIMEHAITEEDEEEDESESGKKRGVATNSNADESGDGGSAAADEWREIELTYASDRQPRAELAAAVSGKSEPESAPESLPATTFQISFAEAFAFCVQSDDLLLQRDKIVAEDFAEPGRSCFACFSPRPRLLFPNALDERDRVFCLAATGYAACSGVFSRVLQTLYARLMRTQREVPLAGSHWEDIGFQGNDPATDLRGCGVLSLLQMLFLVEKHAELARHLHSLSQHPTRHFPLACTLINVTLQCVLALRSGALYKECNRQASVFNAINQFYVALAAELMDEIHSSSDEVPIVMKEVLDDARANPDRVLEHFAKAGMQSPASPRKPAGRSVEFTEIALQSAASSDDDDRGNERMSE
ncbi:hypothetical protein PybrP1_004358 [[Pythium] brassicae (nom. inval.)]|nr:hypothetical protein PybrP1_004358 [[Pythium] brassicae (nom. inval.)]